MAGGRPAIPMYAPLSPVEDLLAEGALSVNDAAKHCGISRRQLYRVLASGELKAFRQGVKLLIPRRALVKWQAEQYAKDNGI